MDAAQSKRSRDSSDASSDSEFDEDEQSSKSRKRKSNRRLSADLESSLKEAFVKHGRSRFSKNPCETHEDEDGFLDKASLKRG